MPQRLVVTHDSSGLPKAEVPFACMWDLVEYLSYQRVTVSYHYQATHFVVTFPRQDLAAAQEVLDTWVTSSMQELQTV